MLLLTTNVVQGVLTVTVINRASFAIFIDFICNRFRMLCHRLCNPYLTLKYPSVGLMYLRSVPVEEFKDVTMGRERLMVTVLI